jgi:hypothetical protein
MSDHRFRWGRGRLPLCLREDLFTRSVFQGYESNELNQRDPRIVTLLIRVCKDNARKAEIWQKNSTE